MSHDIRTPMNAIIGMTDLALENVGTQMPTSEYLQIIKSSSMHLLTLINDILDMSRIEKGKLIIEHRPFNLALEIDRFCSRNQVLMNKKQLQFRHSTKLQHENVLGDVLHLQRIWDNIISNAIKFTPEGGTVSFEVCELPPKNSHIGYYQFVISDTGIGIDKTACRSFLTLSTAATKLSAIISKVPVWGWPSSKTSLITKAARSR